MSVINVRLCRPRRMLVALSALLFVYGFYMGGLQYVIADISSAFMQREGNQGVGIGILTSVPHFISMFFPVLIGIIADRFGKKKMLLTFIGVFTVGCGIAGGASGMIVYLVGVTLVGVGHSVCESVSTAVLSDMDPDNAARNINISQGVLSAGAVLGPILLRWLILATGASWRYVFFVSAAGFVVMFLLLMPMAFPVAAPAPEKKQEKRKTSVLSSSALLCALLAMTLYVSMEKGIGNFAESHFTNDLGREDIGAYAISLYWIGTAVSRLLIGLKMEKLQRTLIVHFGITAVLFVMLSLSGFAYLSLAACLLMGFAHAPIWSALVAFGTQRFPEHSGAVAGLMSSFGSFGSMASPLLMGVVSEAFGIRIGFLLMTVFAVGGGTLVLFTNKGKNRKKTA